MKEQAVPYRRVIYICTNMREEEGRPACAKRGSEALCERIKEEVKKRGLKGKVRAMKSGCMDLCEQGPNVMVFPDGAWHSGVSLDDVPTLVEKYL
jgi:(2Fe-2S) ferredoxin